MAVDEKKPRRPPPLKRAEVQPKLVTAADAFSLMQYDERRRDTPVIGELETTGTLPGMPAVLADTAFSLWAHNPGVKDEVSADRRYWRDLLGETVKTSAFKTLAGQTRSDWLLSTLGTIEATKEILRLVPKEDAEQLDDISKAQTEADDLERDAAEAEAQAQAFENLLAQMAAQAQTGGPGSASSEAMPGNQSPGQGQSGSGSGQAQPGQGSPSGSTSAGMSLTPQQAERLASELAKAKAKAGDARQLADLAKAEANAKADTLLGMPGSVEAERKLTELRRLGMGAVKKAAEKVGDTADTIRAWGLEPGELNRMPVPEALELLEKMRRNASFKAFAELLGRLRRIAKAKAKSNDRVETRVIPSCETGRDIRRADTSELVAYAAHPATRMQMLTRWARGTLSLRAAEVEQTPKGRGPVVACIDTSGSMDGERNRWAKAVSLALASYAKVQRRSFGWMIFDSVVQAAKVFPVGRVSARDLLMIAEAGSGGGTDFEPPLRRAMEMVNAEGLSKADIVFVTDGECAVGEAFLREFLAWKKAHGVTVVGIIVDNRVSDVTVRKFADRTERVTRFTADAAEKQVFAHL